MDHHDFPIEAAFSYLSYIKSQIPSAVVSLKEGALDHQKPVQHLRKDAAVLARGYFGHVNSVVIPTIYVLLLF